jgi:uncharacterized protein YqgQ
MNNKLVLSYSHKIRSSFKKNIFKAIINQVVTEQKGIVKIFKNRKSKVELIQIIKKQLIISKILRKIKIIQARCFTIK